MVTEQTPHTAANIYFSPDGLTAQQMRPPVQANEPGSNGLQGRLPAAVFAPRHLGRTHDQAQAPANMAPPEP